MWSDRGTNISVGVCGIESESGDTDRNSNGFSQTTPGNNFGNNVTLATNQNRTGVNFGSAATRSSIAAASSLVFANSGNSLASRLFGDELIA